MLDIESDGAHRERAERGSGAPQPSYSTLPKLSSPPPTILDYLVERYPRVGRETWRSRMRRGLVLTDAGRPVAESDLYEVGIRLRYFREVAEEPRIPEAETIVHRDDSILVADKPPFLPVTPAGPYVNQSLLYRLRSRTGLEELSPIHRLDWVTAGLVLFAVRKRDRRAYHELFERGEVEKKYLALARIGDLLVQRQWRVENRIVKGSPWFRMRIDEAGPANAASRITLLDARPGLGLFRVVPETGKQHQVRLHLSGLGFPVLNDRLYPVLQPKQRPDFRRPLMLLASRLSFRDPLTGRSIELRSERRLPW